MSHVLPVANWLFLKPFVKPAKHNFSTYWFILCKGQEILTTTIVNVCYLHYALTRR